MMLLTILPAWNSLDSVRRAHNDLELSGLVFFALLVIAEALAHTTADKKKEHLFNTFGVWLFAVAVLCELVAYPYGQRNDELSAQIIGSLDILAHDAANTANGAKGMADTAKSEANGAKTTAEDAKTDAEKAKASVANVRKKADQIDQALGMAQFFLSDRQIIEPESLKTKLAAYKEKPFFFRSYVNDGDGYFLCKELVWIATSVGINPTDQCARFEVEPPYPMTGINVFARDEKTMLSLNSILAGTTGYGSSGTIIPNSTAIVVFVGRKNRAFVGETAQTRAAENHARKGKNSASP